jgi:hypothetical protein
MQPLGSTQLIPETCAEYRYELQRKCDMLLYKSLFYESPYCDGVSVSVKLRLGRGRARGRAPAALRSAAALSRASFLLPTATILAPSAASNSAAARPMPEDAPVTTTTLPSKRACCTQTAMGQPILIQIHITFATTFSIILWQRIALLTVSRYPAMIEERQFAACLRRTVAIP